MSDKILNQYVKRFDAIEGDPEYYIRGTDERVNYVWINGLPFHIIWCDE